MQNATQRIDTAERFAAARADEFSAFYEYWQPRLYRYVCRTIGERDADEITQETFARAYESLDLSRPRRNKWGWLVVVARNVAGDMHRTRRYCEVGPGEEGATDAPEPAYAGFEQDVLDQECLSVLSRAMIGLPPSQSRVWWLTIAEGMTPAAIASSLDCSPAAVRQALFKSRRRLAGSLAEFCGRVQGLALPALVALRRLLHKSAAQASRPTANFAMAAAMSSSLMIGAIAILAVPPGSGSPAGAAQTIGATHPAADTRAARPATAAHLTVISRTTRRAPSASAPSRNETQANVWVAQKPLAPGHEADAAITIVTPAGPISTKHSIIRSEGGGIVCGRTDLVKCD